MFHKALADKATLTNGWVSMPSSHLAELFAAQAYDVVTIDMQHGLVGVESLVSMLQAIEARGKLGFVRVPWNEPSILQRCLDAGAEGLIVPMINTAEEARALVEATCYPPEGSRSYGPARGLLKRPDYVKTANQVLSTWAMIETRQAYENLDAILEVEGLSGIFIGPSDLSMSLEGKVSNPLSDAIQAQVVEMVERARAKGLYAGVFCGDAAFARKVRDAGAHLVTLMNDAGLIRSAIAKVFKDYEA